MKQELLVFQEPFVLRIYNRRYFFLNGSVAITSSSICYKIDFLKTVVSI